MTRGVHTTVRTVDATVTGPIEDILLEKWEHRRVALRVIADESVSGTPEFGLQSSVDKNAWVLLEKETGPDVDMLREVPEPYLRPTIETAADSGTVQLWMAASV